MKAIIKCAAFLFASIVAVIVNNHFHIRLILCVADGFAAGYASQFVADRIIGYLTQSAARRYEPARKGLIK
jgi:hypothetical protein